MDNTQLYHWGIKGMKWGVRRYQNADGSLTPAGRKRYGGDSDSSVKGGKTGSSTSTSTQSSKSKSISEMSDTELRAAVARLQLEKQYKDLMPKEEKTVSAGMKFLKSVGGTVASALGEASKTVLKEYVTKAAKDKLGLNEKKEKSKLEKLREAVEIEEKKKAYKKLTDKDWKDD